MAYAPSSILIVSKKNEIQFILKKYYINYLKCTLRLEIDHKREVK